MRLLWQGKQYQCVSKGAVTFSPASWRRFLHHPTVAASRGTSTVLCEAPPGESATKPKRANAHLKKPFINRTSSTAPNPEEEQLWWAVAQCLLEFQMPLPVGALSGLNTLEGLLSILGEETHQLLSRLEVALWQSSATPQARFLFRQELQQRLQDPSVREERDSLRCAVEQALDASSHYNAAPQVAMSLMRRVMAGLLPLNAEKVAEFEHILQVHEKRLGTAQQAYFEELMPWTLPYWSAEKNGFGQGKHEGDALSAHPLYNFLGPKSPHLSHMPLAATMCIGLGLIAPPDPGLDKKAQAAVLQADAAYGRAAAQLLKQQPGLLHAQLHVIGGGQQNQLGSAVNIMREVTEALAAALQARDLPDPLATAVELSMLEPWLVSVRHSSFHKHYVYQYSLDEVDVQERLLQLCGLPVLQRNDKDRHALRHLLLGCPSLLTEPDRTFISTTLPRLRVLRALLVDISIMHHQQYRQQPAEVLLSVPRKRLGELLHGDGGTQDISQWEAAAREVLMQGAGASTLQPQWAADDC